MHSVCVPHRPACVLAKDGKQCKVNYDVIQYGTSNALPYYP